MMRCPEFHVPVSARRDVEVALDFVALETAVDATAVFVLVPRDARGFDEFARWVGTHVA